MRKNDNKISVGFRVTQKEREKLDRLQNEVENFSLVNEGKKWVNLMYRAAFGEDE